MAIDAPEKGQFFGDSSKIHLTELLEGKKIRYEIQSHDQYGRALVILFADEENINLQMVKDGYAWSYYYNKKQEYINAMKEAKSKKLGLWKYENPIDPYFYRKTH